MAKTYAQIQAQIRKLQQEADALKAKEVAIQHYGLTVQDLFGSARPTAKARTAARRTKAGKATKATKPPAPAKFQDAAGHQWSGIGKRPNWFKAALAAGQTADSLRIQPPSAG
jgi:DNA-binding protein H-NS